MCAATTDRSVEILILDHCYAKKYIETYQCGECFKLLKGPYCYAYHQEQHKPDSGFRCFECNRYYADRKRLINHIDAAHPDLEKYSCETCRVMYHHKETLKQHLYTDVSEEMPWFCEICSATFPCKAICKMHRQATHPHSTDSEDSDSSDVPEIRPDVSLVGEYYDAADALCVHCLVLFESPVQLENHVCPAKQHTDEESSAVPSTTLVSETKVEHPHRLRRCMMCYNGLAALHAGEPVCFPCQGHFTSASQLEKYVHLRKCGIRPSQAGKHVGLSVEVADQGQKRGGPKQCSHCHTDLKPFSAAEISHREHRIVDVAQLLPLFAPNDPDASEYGQMPCDFCRKEFSNIGHLCSHFASAFCFSQEWLKSIKCPCCDQVGFSDRGEFFSHARQHRLTCKFCGKMLEGRKALRDHINEHTGVKPYTCDVCGKQYARRFLLIVHLKRHSDGDGEGKRPYPCEVCGKIIAKCRLKRHIKNVHEGVRQKRYLSNKRYERKPSYAVSCKVCGKQVKSRSLLSHMALHDTSKVYTCDRCGETFKTRGNLKYHMKVKCSFIKSNTSYP